MASIVVGRYLFQSTDQSVILGHQLYGPTAQEVKDGAVKVDKHHSSVVARKLEIAVFLGEPDLGWCRTTPMLEIPTPQPVPERVDRQGIVHDVGCRHPHKGACGVAGGAKLCCNAGYTCKAHRGVQRLAVRDGVAHLRKRQRTCTRPSANTAQTPTQLSNSTSSNNSTIDGAAG